MSISRINAFLAKDETITELKQFLSTLTPIISATPGCISCQLLQSELDLKKFLILEVWESKEAHQSSVKNIPVKDLQTVIGLLASPPTGEYFSHP